MWERWAAAAAEREHPAHTDSEWCCPDRAAAPSLFPKCTPEAAPWLPAVPCEWGREPWGRGREERRGAAAPCQAQQHAIHRSAADPQLAWGSADVQNTLHAKLSFGTGQPSVLGSPVPIACMVPCRGALLSRFAVCPLLDVYRLFLLTATGLHHMSGITPTRATQTQMWWKTILLY